MHRAYPGTSKGFGHGTRQGCYRRYWTAVQVTRLVGKRVLDVGCAYGWLVPFAVGAGVTEYVGLDLVPGFVEECRRLWTDVGDRVHTGFVVGDAREPLWPDLFFDVVFCLGPGTGEITEAFAWHIMCRCWALAKEALVFSLPYGSGPDDEWLPRAAMKLTGKVVLLRDYWGPDQMVWMYRENAH